MQEIRKGFNGMGRKSEQVKTYDAVGVVGSGAGAGDAEAKATRQATRIEFEKRILSISILVRVVWIDLHVRLKKKAIELRYHKKGNSRTWRRNRLKLSTKMNDVV